MLSVTHIALENCPISKVTVDRDQRGDSGGAEQHGEGEAETLDEDGPEFFATTCLTGLCLLKCFARYIFFVAQDAKLTTTSGVHTVIIGTRSRGGLKTGYSTTTSPTSASDFFCPASSSRFLEVNVRSMWSTICLYLPEIPAATMCWCDGSCPG